MSKRREGERMKRFLDTFTQDYLDDILVRLAHHSAGIEGNTISLPAMSFMKLRTTNKLLSM